MDLAFWTLLHLLVLVYWLGGDLGAFYTSRFLTAQGVSADRRLMAAKIVGDVDMAPRTALILALPTGLSLAASRQWLSVDAPLLALVWALSLAWLALAWRLHFSHGAAPAWMGLLDRFTRYALVAGLIIASAAGLMGALGTPLFLNLKLALLALATTIGLGIRQVLKPLGPALAGLHGPDAETAEATLAQTLNTARPLVLGIWACLLGAAFLGVWTPT